MQVLVVEDDAILNKNIIEALKAENIHAQGVFDGLLAEKLLKKESYDCVVMDVNLPGKNGFDLCRDFRSHDTQTPVLMLTAFSELDDKVKGYECGADDYLTKPFYMRELILKTRSLAKRNKKGGTSESIVITAGDITINTQQKKVLRQGIELQLTPREYQILLRLCENKGDVVSKKDLIRDIWGKSVESTNTIEVYVNFLRNKVDKPFEKSVIKTKIGYGYYIDAE